MTMLCLMLME